MKLRGAFADAAGAFLLLLGLMGALWLLAGAPSWEARRIWVGGAYFLGVLAPWTAQALRARRRIVAAGWALGFAGVAFGAVCLTCGLRGPALAEAARVTALFWGVPVVWMTLFQRFRAPETALLVGFLLSVGPMLTPWLARPGSEPPVWVLEANPLAHLFEGACSVPESAFEWFLAGSLYETLGDGGGPITHPRRGAGLDWPVFLLSAGIAGHGVLGWLRRKHRGHPRPR